MSSPFRPLSFLRVRRRLCLLPLPFSSPPSSFLWQEEMREAKHESQSGVWYNGGTATCVIPTRRYGEVEDPTVARISCADYEENACRRGFWCFLQSMHL
ncbi:hypothetical protein AXF42_Ash014930 [Apostasia shenzhenica]|uniref:Uncharacterized protein n=1 Tax=Apostasia shenzhenica TaxID=1088818 RepID=A0A2I0ALK4_9ASPA|nr:hypothetical protein AXF42_Ash014930 [Apostasia shenzhenica]